MASIELKDLLELRHEAEVKKVSILAEIAVYDRIIAFAQDKDLVSEEEKTEEIIPEILEDSI